MNTDLMIQAMDSYNNTMILAQGASLDLTQMSASGAPQVNIIWGPSVTRLMGQIGAVIGIFWFFFFVAKLAIPNGQGGRLGQMAQKIGGVGGTIVAFILVAALLQPDIAISILNFILKISYMIYKAIMGALSL